MSDHTQFYAGDQNQALVYAKQDLHRLSYTPTSHCQPCLVDRLLLTCCKYGVSFSIGQGPQQHRLCCLRLVILLFLYPGVFGEVESRMANTSCLLRPDSYQGQCLFVVVWPLSILLPGPLSLQPAPFFLRVCWCQRQEALLSLSSFYFLS